MVATGGIGIGEQALEPFGFAVELDAIPAHGSDEARHLQSLYQRDGLLVVRGLRLSHEEQADFCRLFGPVSQSPCDSFIVSNVDANGHLGKRELLWHHDVPYLPSPYFAGCLHALRVDADAVSTRFVSGFRAYERLSEAMRRRIEGMKALHVRERVFDRPNRLTDLIEGDMCCVHDLVRTDPATGRKYLFINEAWTALIIGLSQDDSDALHAELNRHQYVASEVYEHDWAEGDMVLWNNLALQHARGEAGSGVRTLQRVTITALGYADQYPTDLGIGTSLGNEVMLAEPA